jgi:signal transduction histidine kinase
MQFLQSILMWFSGGAGHQYMQLAGCMRRDYFWIGVTITLDFSVAIGYVLIAYHWSRNEKQLPPSPAKTALKTMRNIFVFCGICGYLFIPIKMIWPAWRLYDMFMLVLVFYTWRYALNAKNLKVIYTAIGRSNQLAEDLAQSREESKRKSFFLNAISHDLRTPLNGLVLHADLAELQIASGDQAAVQQSLAEIKASVRLTADLLDGLLEYARLETTGDQPVLANFDLGELLTDVLNSHAALAAKKSLALTHSPCPTVKLRTDRLRLERILNNLITNAIKFTDAGSVRIDVECSHDGVEISVVDTGIGIKADHQKRLFEEFFQVQNHERDRQKGFGLGLAICNRLVRQLGGDLRVESEPGKGSKFTVVLPEMAGSVRAQTVSAAPAIQTASINRPAAGAAGGG